MSSLHFGNYLNEIATVPLLTHQEEIELGTAIFLVSQLRKLTQSAAFNHEGKEQDIEKLSEVTKIPREKVISLLQEHYAGLENPERQAAREAACQEAVLKLVGANLRLVVKCAGYYRFSHHDIEELTAEGNRGLMIAAEKYDPTIGTRFSTYATWWIQQSIRMAVNSSHTIRTPVRRASQLAKLMTSNAYDHDSEEQDIAKLSEETNISEEEVVKLLKCRTQLVPMDAPFPGGDGAATLQSAIPSGDVAADAQLIESERLHLLRELVQKMQEPKRQVLTLRFGLDNQPVQTLEEIAVVLNVTRERIRKIQLEAVRILQEEFQKLGFNISTEALIDLKRPAKKTKSNHSLSQATRAKLSSAQKARWQQKRTEKAAGQAPVAQQPLAAVSTAEAEANPQPPPVMLPAQQSPAAVSTAEAEANPQPPPVVLPAQQPPAAVSTAEAEANPQPPPVILPAQQPPAAVSTAEAEANPQPPPIILPAQPQTESAPATISPETRKLFIETKQRFDASMRKLQESQVEPSPAQPTAQVPEGTGEEAKQGQVQGKGQAQAPKNPMPVERRLRISASLKAFWAKRRAEKGAAELCPPASDEAQQLQNAA
jgi:RNA polymerase sigma factor (sigma-70 family)